MLDINRIVQNPEELLSTLQKRGVVSTDIEAKIKSVSEKQRKLKLEVEDLRAERNRVSKEIGIQKSQGKDITEISASMKGVGDRIKAIEEELTKEEESLHELNLSLPNLLDSSVPEGKSEEDNVLIRQWGEVPKLSFEPKTHFDIGEKLGIFDFERGVKLSGARFYTYRGLGAKLERALMNLMLDTHTSENGYEEMWVPVLVNDESMTATGQLPKFAEDFYRLEKDGLNLIPTAEVPLTNYYRDEIISEKELPISVCAHTSCFRREAGSYGRDTRGLVRVHQFQKVELVKFVEPETSQTEHEKMLLDAESILQKLKLPYRVMLLCSKDMSSASSKTYDIEVWMPGLGRFMEISSVSNFKDYQARRGKIRYKSKEGKNLLVHTLNGSGLAIGRTLAAVIENYQSADGTFQIPDVLKPYIR
ncbi:serine--tRNA ligase [Leptospira sp. 2 VSF19]|uniref:Serine--tRNA ligase n=1 Tax=Leptospira soteropolitanensis TaxID=2950025 RepID=A0AAW5VBC0_9LEPT|nr:serine--tRNA ligase [Leptospira soteropolitanensis]MCW7491538.1 serine--tRNA ligase [Leptospira soteropolitanensis]MCW7499122.1 serine--tRNA ligase [Leptospira soteropolitanensis]MCW7521286.1 serine--tRNA ligase [Leptospira soteropolitanensis]MCW7525226.1 serine--tRNA ligase [Leptospira soteropolitanensis]MCW7529093.1 serine--tRNA ligase [Leptospira soteropolitanensis]